MAVHDVGGASLCRENLPIACGDAVGQKDDFDATDADLLDPGRRHIRRMPDDELAELARNPASKLGQLAASEMRSRESWRGPGRWSLIVASLALLVSVAAITRTF